MDKLTKTFQAGEVLKAQDLNNMSAKVNEIVDNVNTGGSGGSGGSITVDSSLSTTSINPVQNKVVTAELNKRVDKVTGKVLSTNDYTTPEKQKLSGLPSSAYSKNEIDVTVTQLREDINNVQTGDSSSPYTRGRMKKIHVKVTGLPTDTYSVKHCALKYDADNVISFTTDDGNTSSLSVAWAAINKRPISVHPVDGTGADKAYQYHANQYLAKDIPDEIIYKTYNDFLTFKTIFGTRERFKHGVAIWPYCGNSQGQGMSFFMDRDQPVNPSAGNLYRFLSPFLNWTDCNLMKHYGTDFYFHNIGTETYGCDKDILNCIQGLLADMARTKAMTGRTMKILARPDGNNTFISAMNEMPKIDMALGENSPAVDCKPNVDTDYYHKVLSRFFKDDVEGILKPQLATLINDTPSNDKTWYHFCCHTATGAFADFLKFISDTYGNNTSDKTKRLWFCTAGELYEYMYFKKYGRFINIKNSSGTFEFDYEFSFKDNFNYKDVTFKITNSAGTQISIGSIDAYDAYTNDKAYCCQTASDSDGALVHLNIEETFIESIEFFVSKYEETADSIWREDAELDLPKLIPSLRTQYQARLDAVSNPVNITSLSLNKSSLNLSNSVSGTIAITALPVDNSQMSKLTYTLRDIGNINVSLSVTNNVATATVVNTNNVVGTYNGYIKFKVEGSSIVSNEIPIQVIVESTTVEKPITSLQLECETTVDKKKSLFCTCTALPSDTTDDIRNIVITTTGNVVNKQYSGNDKIIFDVIWGTAKTDTITVSIGEVSDSKVITINEVVAPPATEDDNTLCMVSYSYSDHGNTTYLVDSKYGGTINLENASYLQQSHGATLYSKSGKALQGWKKNGDEQQDYVTGLGKTYQSWQATPAQTGSCSNVFSINPAYYKYVYKYATQVANCLIYTLPNGSYKIRFLSSTTAYEDVYTNASSISINGTEVLSQFPTTPYKEDQMWTDFIEFTVTDGKLIILFDIKPSKRTGFNALEIKKVS